MKPENLSDQLNVSHPDIEERKRLFGITEEHLEALGTCKRSVLPQLDEVIEAFYLGQLANPAIRRFIDDPTTLATLKGAMKRYVTTLFGGDYGEDYVAARLRIGMAHAQIGVQPMYYVASVHQLAELLKARLAPYEFNPLVASALDKILLFDLVLVFDTYIQGLVDEATRAKDELAVHVRGLEKVVAERTASLKRLAQTDDLTGLRNRRALIATLADEIVRIRREGGGFAIAFLDVDKFKAVNDTHGHIAGDRVLQRIARAFQASIPDPDRVYRYGGDEFVAIFPLSPGATAPEAATRIKTAIEAHLAGEISVSVGCANVTHDAVPSLEDILTSIDEEMYRHKAANQVPCAPAAPRIAVAGG